MRGAQFITLFVLAAMGQSFCFSQAPNTGGSAPAATATTVAPGSFSVPDIAGITKSISGSLLTANPGTEVVSWNGQNWAVTDNRLFESMFFKYLATPPWAVAGNYLGIMSRIKRLLTGKEIPAQNIDEAYNLLLDASMIPEDGDISDVLANQIYASWAAQRNTAQMAKSNQYLRDQRKRLYWNLQMASKQDPLEAQSAGSFASTGSNKGFAGQMPTSTGAGSGEQGAKIQPIAARLAETELMIKSNDAKGEMSIAQARTEFTTLLTQLFLQRRFQHLEIGIKFYRNIFGEGSSQVNLGSEASKIFSKTSGNPPTLGSLESMGVEMAQNVRQGVQAFKYLLEAGELQSASKRLEEAYLVGQNMPELYEVDLASKRTVLAYMQKERQLISAIEVKNYDLAEQIIKELHQAAKDLDTTKADAAVNGAKMASDMHLAKAKNAAHAGDKASLEAELSAAADIWPSNPKLKEALSTIYEQADVQAKSIADFDQLVGQKNYRRVYDDKVRFIAATAMLPDKREQLRKVLEDMQTIETSILRSEEISKHGDYAGAWESVETVGVQFPDDNRLNQYRANLTTKAAEFVNAIRRAETFEKKGDVGTALTSYLAARRIYPPSQMAEEGIIRLSKVVMPDGQ